jgi:hypothetical protein
MEKKPSRLKAAAISLTTMPSRTSIAKMQTAKPLRQDRNVLTGTGQGRTVVAQTEAEVLADQEEVVVLAGVQEMTAVRGAAVEIETANQVRV